MAETAVHIIGSLRKKWIAVTCVSLFVISVACNIVIAVCLYKFSSWTFLWGIPGCIITFFILLYYDRSWKINKRDIARYLNNKYPALEESAELLLVPSSTLPYLQRLQAKKNEQVLGKIYQPGQFNSKIIFSFRVLLTALITGAGLFLIPFPSFQKTIIRPSASPRLEKKEKLLPAISSVTIGIQPPSYTRRPVRTQERFNLEVEEGAHINWRIKTNSVVKNIRFIFNDTKIQSLKPVNEQHTLWSFDKIINAPGFYQVEMDSVISERYMMEVLKDQPPSISVHEPKANTVIDYGDPAQVTLNVTVTDDYGVRSVSVAATISSGSGEAVQFDQQQINFGGSFTSQLPQYQLKKSIDLSSLGMKPGDELYFYFKAIDNNLQEKRSDIFIVSITDTAQLMSVNGLMNAIGVNPEYFRSERQIIIETEQLIKDKDKLNKDEFQHKCNNLGIDQKLLRLRYGKFLGEEDESNEEELHGIDTDPKDFGNAGKILDAYTDKHDNAEDAGFFDAGTKNQLKATLTEMWNAELKLRTFNPVDALPYEYKALRLLKDLQQKSRAYVAKTNFTTTPLKPEKRLTADLSKIIEPFRQKNIRTGDTPDEVLRTALSVLEQLKDENYDPGAQAILEQASVQLSAGALISPSTYLPSLEGLKRIIIAVGNRSGVSVADISMVKSALQNMIGTPDKLPYTNKKASNINLSRLYFRNLSNPGHR